MSNMLRNYDGKIRIFVNTEIGKNEIRFSPSEGGKNE